MILSVKPLEPSVSIAASAIENITVIPEDQGKEDHKGWKGSLQFLTNLNMQSVPNSNSETTKVGKDHVEKIEVVGGNIAVKITKDHSLNMSLEQTFLTRI